MLIGGLGNELQSAAASRNVEAARRSIERLSAGQRIMRAADDPAGLVSAENLRFQGGTMAIALRNIQDGVGVLRVADGALETIMGLVERGRELKLSSAGSHDPEAALAAAAEWQGLGLEIDSVAGTEYAGTPLLDGSFELDVLVGSEPPEHVSIALRSDAGSFGLAGLSLGAAGLPASLSLLTVDAFDAALGQILVARARIGVTENRLAYAAGATMTAMLNARDAEDRLIAVDSPSELVSLTRSQLLSMVGGAGVTKLGQLHRDALSSLIPAVSVAVPSILDGEPSPRLMTIPTQDLEDAARRVADRVAEDAARGYGSGWGASMGSSSTGGSVDAVF